MSKTWRLEAQREFRDIANEAVPLVRAAARNKLPRAGGLNEYVANQNITVTSVLAGASMTVRVRHDTHRSAKQTDSGYVRHPVFGVWRPGIPSQQVPNAAGWWTQTFENLGPMATERMLQFIREMSAAIEASSL
jgi:hypothetical protein